MHRRGDALRLLRHFNKIVLFLFFFRFVEVGSRDFKHESFVRLDAADFIASFEAESVKGTLCFEEKLVWGLMINALKTTQEHKLALLRAFVPVMDNWAVCDTICCNIKWIKDKVALWEYLQPYFDSDREFDVRSATQAST